MFLACWAAAGSEPECVYTSDLGAAVKLGGELHDALPQKFFDQLDAQTIAAQPQESPMIIPVTISGDKRVQRQVELSAGFIDLVNHLCHAKAIDNVQSGYFNQYVENLSRACATNPAAPLPPIVGSGYWSERIINDQLSYFNQMIGMMMAINMSHHYLGHYAKYATQLAARGEKPECINDFLTPAEWEISVKAGAQDGLTCALSTDGLRVIFDALDKMPVRPAWADYVAPRNANFKKLDHELATYEYDFFHGRVKD